MTFTGKTRLLGLIGDPVAQARTPTLVNQMLAQRGLLGDFVLAPMHVSANGLDNVIRGLRELQNFAGAVVTMPHKSSVVQLLDDLTPEARVVGAVNVIKRDQSGALVGTALDGEGFVSGLRAASHTVRGKTCVLVGAGGAASAIAFALVKHQCGALYLLNRSQEKAQLLASRVQRAFPHAKIGVTLPSSVDIDIAINGTSLGMRPEDVLPMSEELIARSALVAECVIAPEATALLQLAASQGKLVHSGLPMLTSQLQLMLDFMGV